MAIIVIDPGHGGTRNLGGSSWNNAKGTSGLLEKTVTLDVARAAQQALAESGHTVVMTRNADVNVGIDERAAKARQSRADAFVSIHFNAPGGSTPAQGTETWIGTSHTELSKKLATAVQREVTAATGYADRGVKAGSVSGVINARRHLPQTANCLVEISFLSLHPQEEARLRSAAYIKKLGEAVARGIRKALAERGPNDLQPETAWLPGDAECEDAAAANHAERYDSEADDRLPLASGEVIPLTQRGSPADDQRDRKVPFIVPFGTIDHPFDDLNGDAPVDDPNRMLEGLRIPERAIGPYLTTSASLLEILSTARRAVGKISASGIGYDGGGGNWVGTGFLVGHNLLLTNHHVLNSPDVAASASIEFDFEIAADSLRVGKTAIAATRKVFKLDPGRLFLTSPYHGGLDYTFVWIDEAASKEFSLIPMDRSSFTARPQEQAFIIHHPAGRPTVASLDDTDIVSVDSKVVHYASDTLGGSSGSPVFNQQGRLIALHHASLPKDVELPGGHKANFVNEGIKIAAIAILKPACVAIRQRRRWLATFLQ
jgi:N-acetylmuramoyl-L-alanine amidase